jgi:hypothetical protein
VPFGPEGGVRNPRDPKTGEDGILHALHKPLRLSLTDSITKRAVNPCLNSATGQAPEIGFGLSGRGCFPDLESPSPQARPDQQKGKFNAIAHRDLGGIRVERHG